jgi:hypothetical protein
MGAMTVESVEMRFLVLLLVLLCFGVAACDGEVLVVSDAGVDVDAGLVDAGLVDAGLVDAGLVDAGVDVEFDAGFVDAGPQPDAGFPCPFPENPPQPVPCEDDADYCDPIEPQFSPEADILAAWSHIDGDEFVMQVRLLAPPFRRIPSLDLRFVVGEAEAVGYGSAISRNDSGTDDLFAVHGYVLRQDLRFPAGAGFPPPAREVEFPQGESPPPFDPCWFSLSTTTGLVEFRFPLRGEPLPYAIGAYGGDDFLPPTNDVTWSGAPQTLISQGGRADDEGTLVSICDLTCPYF